MKLGDLSSVTFFKDLDESAGTTQNLRGLGLDNANNEDLLAVMLLEITAFCLSPNHRKEMFMG